ncbi:MAG: indole-3-glycerol phosphate synthase [Candidatus Binatia bacterium]|nr:MAG: indole-3-glycerol phosphate synthase [Candidatus Binatia bacterium]
MILDRILERRRERLAEAKRRVPEAELRARSLYSVPRRSFLAALSAPGRRIVAEVKRASPSRGEIRSGADAAEIAREYREAGAAAVSVLTEPDFFRGSSEDLVRVRETVDLPLLRKDFLFDPYQVLEARALGADAVLWIVAALPRSALSELLACASEAGLDSLVEVHDERELEDALAAGATIVGINNRDLRTFETSLEVTERLVRLVPPGVVVVAESGIDGPADVRRLERSGVRRFLVGETLMRAPSPGAKLRELLEAA